MSASAVICPCCQASLAVVGDSGTCSGCKAQIEIFSSPEAARATAEYRENARVSVQPDSNLWIVAVA